MRVRVRVRVGSRVGVRVGWGRGTKLGADWSTALRVCFIVRMSSAWVRASIWAKQGVRVRFTVRVGVRVRVKVTSRGLERRGATVSTRANSA